MLRHHRTTAALDAAFVPAAVAVFTWFAVGRFDHGTDLLNTFQAVLASWTGVWAACAWGRGRGVAYPGFAPPPHSRSLRRPPFICDLLLRACCGM